MARTANDSLKITVTLPKALVRRLRKQVPARVRDQFVAHALEESLALAEQTAVLEETAGVWKESDYPELKTPEDIDRWLAALRGGWFERFEQRPTRLA